MTHLTQAIHHLRRADPAELKTMPIKDLLQLRELVWTWWGHMPGGIYSDGTMSICFVCDGSGLIAAGDEAIPCTCCGGEGIELREAA